MARPREQLCLSVLTVGHPGQTLDGHFLISFSQQHRDGTGTLFLPHFTEKRTQPQRAGLACLWGEEGPVGGPSLQPHPLLPLSLSHLPFSVQTVYLEASSLSLTFILQPLHVHLRSPSWSSTTCHLHFLPAEDKGSPVQASARPGPYPAQPCHSLAVAG